MTSKTSTTPRATPMCSRARRPRLRSVYVCVLVPHCNTRTRTHSHSHTHAHLVQVLREFLDTFDTGSLDQTSAIGSKYFSYCIVLLSVLPHTHIVFPVFPPVGTMALIQARDSQFAFPPSLPAMRNEVSLLRVFFEVTKRRAPRPNSWSL